MREDYYQLLDVEPSATPAEIKRGYYRQAKRFHPDRHANSPESEERFKLIAEAYRVLGNEERRRVYDESLWRCSRLRDAPELAALAKRRQRRTRVSVRHAQVRRNEGRRTATRYVRRFLIRRQASVSPLWYVLYCLLALSFILPVMFRTPVKPRREENPFAKVESAHLPLDVQKEMFSAYSRGLLEEAERGNVQAQVRYGILLYNGHGAWYGLEKDAEEACRWWQRAAAAGSEQARSLLELARQTRQKPSTPAAEKKS